ncbi:type IV secretory system conjugative DNA transfer family protein [Paraburkholderia phosphatilytica]|uniref:type IV secretory system conjugative DNA transfer family protein n=1 Tax=Paraburkholderia phosphatilytica TaxID=2282883 RepID=UPI003B833868
MDAAVSPAFPRVVPPGNGPALLVGLWRGRYLRLRGQRFVLLAAPARSGKGVGIVIPNLLTYPDSVVVLDIKQENFRITAGFRRAAGHAVFLFNPFAQDGRTHRYNPLSAVSTGVFRVGDILAIAYALYPGGGHDDFWKDQARNLFLGIVLLLCGWRDARRAGNPDAPDCPVTIGEVLRQSSGNGMPLRAHLQQVLVAGQGLVGRACTDALNRFLSNDDRVLASVLATFNAPLVIWANPVVDAATSASDFDLCDVRRRRMSVYIGITPDHLDEAALLVNLVFSQLVNLNTKELPEDNPALQFQCLLLLDELAAPGRIGILARAVAYMAGYNLRLLSVVQSVAQLESVYGHADARTFVTNHAMQILYAPREQRDANEYSEMLGTFTDRSRSVSRSASIFGGRSGPTESLSEQRRPLMLPQELRELPQDREIILLENTKPVLAGRICYWRDPLLRARLVPPPEVQPLDLAGFAARIELGVREFRPDDVDGTGPSLASVSPAGEPGEGRADPVDITGDEAARYVERHFALLGVPGGDVAGASHAQPAHRPQESVSGSGAPGGSQQGPQPGMQPGTQPGREHAEDTGAKATGQALPAHRAARRGARP